VGKIVGYLESLNDCVMTIAQTMTGKEVGFAQTPLSDDWLQDMLQCAVEENKTPEERETDEMLALMQGK
jgi:hypothetical protein